MDNQNNPTNFTPSEKQEQPVNASPLTSYAPDDLTQQQPLQPVPIMTQKATLPAVNPSAVSYQQTGVPLNNMSQPIQPDLPNNPVTPKNHKRGLAICLAVLAILLIGAGSLSALNTFNKSKNSSLATTKPINCTPVAANSVDRATAVTAFNRFAAAVKVSNQKCVDALSTNYFVDSQAKSFPSAKGNWITYSNPNFDAIKSTVDDFKSLPPTINDSNFTESVYGRPYEVNGVLIKAATGKTLSLQLTISGGTKLTMHLSFVAENNQVLADQLEFN
jgi:hypothetical protein